MLQTLKHRYVLEGSLWWRTKKIWRLQLRAGLESRLLICLYCGYCHNVSCMLIWAFIFILQLQLIFLTMLQMIQRIPISKSRMKDATLTFLSRSIWSSQTMRKDQRVNSGNLCHQMEGEGSSRCSYPRRGLVLRVTAVPVVWERIHPGGTTSIMVRLIGSLHLLSCR